ncbi:NAD-dependent epimerase/dehydratase [Beutenbergia cavernae DSM 12333]|uniref:NAD-dependent epimerase/dehydratase n=1 Tax=Beutenbergia cavernae (strain ATCC BAA-8 / DSM 12333 / CCUG 43141 / JCM 11478 / NBRC 16432 / NCIMB 13614 / HKI 0122) TaxID=471853 RepID=C5C2Z7_BEUC1|nr:NAD(P)-dependent oxidoreductase [Beutenbergia cavernae]ACQ81841.1 NAD-dependent epimerase/dehydratase [Beutenbergia cavernae DSM 12333]
MSTKVCVTGSSGRLGPHVVAELAAHGYDVLAVDVAPAPPAVTDLDVATVRADLTDAAQAVDVLAGCDAVVHLANIPAPGLRPDGVTFTTNVTMNHAVFAAARTHGLRRVVWASSETTLGLPFVDPPWYAPVDEAHFPRAESTYALSKVVTEQVAATYARWTGVAHVGLRFSNVLGRDDYRRLFPAAWADPHARKWNLWSYIDARDAASACRLALEARDEQLGAGASAGAPNLVIAAADTCMTRPSAELLAEVFPGVELRRPVEGTTSLFAVDAARDLLGWEPAHTWRDTLEA